MSYGIKTWYKGIEYDSKTEAKYAEYLDVLLKKGKIIRWERQVPFQVKDPAGITYLVIADFVVTFKNKTEIHEVKNNYYSPGFIRKSQLFLERYAHIDYFVLEPDANGNWTKTPLKDFIKPYLYATSPAPTKQYSWVEIKLSEYFYKLVSKFI